MSAAPSVLYRIVSFQFRHARRRSRAVAMMLSLTTRHASAGCKMNAILNTIVGILLLVRVCRGKRRSGKDSGSVLARPACCGGPAAGVWLRRQRKPAAAGLLLLLLGAVRPAAASPRQVQWDDLTVFTGKNVSLVMPGGAAVTGRLEAVEPAALRLKIARTTDPQAYPRGAGRIPRPLVRLVEVHERSRKYRVIGALGGGVLGLVGGFAAAITIQGGILGNKHSAAAGAALIGITGAGAAAGYLVGGRAGRRSTTYEVRP